MTPSAVRHDRTDGAQGDGRSRDAVSRSVASMAAVLVLLAAGCESDRQARLQEVLDRSRLSADRVVELETPFLTDPDPDVRALAVWAIGESGSAGTTAALSGLVTDPAPQVRRSLAKALCRTAEPAALRHQARLARDQDTATRRAAIRCLAGLDRPPSGLLLEALKDADREIRAAALSGLTRQPDPRALPHLLGIFEAKPLEEKLKAIGALRALRDPRAIPALQEAAASTLPITLRNAVEAAIIELRKAESATAAAAEGQESETGSAAGGDGE